MIKKSGNNGNGKKNGKGRPKRKIDLVMVEKLGQIQCTIKEVAAFIDIPEGTLKNRPDFTTAWKKGLEVGKISLRRAQFRLAEKSAGMAIWLGKQYLDQKEKVEITNEELIGQAFEFDMPRANGKKFQRFYN